MFVDVYKFILYVFLINFTLLIWTQQQPVFIVIHGTWAAREKWYMPGGNFFDALTKNPTLKPARIIPYRWSGKNSYKERMHAAKGLVQLIQSYPSDTLVYLVTHSHGGNIGIIASQLLATKKENSNKIHIFYALGTPVDKTHYLPNMDIINYFYHLFSFEDLIQPVFGLFEREYPTHERIANICIILNNKKPNHTQLHSPLVGQWLATLHETLMGIKDFNFNKPGIVHFTEHKKPIYTLDKKREQAIERDQLLQKMLSSTLFRKQQLYSSSHD